MIWRLIGTFRLEDKGTDNSAKIARQEAALPKQKYLVRSMIKYEQKK
jgi:hypothetical protein